MRPTVFTRLCSLIVALGFLAVVASPASAAPTNAKKADFAELTCSNGAVYSIVANGNGNFTPAHILDGEGRTLIPVAFSFVVTNENGDVVFADTVAHPGQMNGLSGDLVDCTFTATDTDPETGEVLTATVTATLFVTPRE
jgi:hypothetical protein